MASLWCCRQTQAPVALARCSATTTSAWRWHGCATGTMTAATGGTSGTAVSDDDVGRNIREVTVNTNILILNVIWCWCWCWWCWGFICRRNVQFLHVSLRCRRSVCALQLQVWHDQGLSWRKWRTELWWVTVTCRLSSFVSWHKSSKTSSTLWSACLCFPCVTILCCDK